MLPFSVWTFWTRIDAYQIREILSDAPVAQAASTGYSADSVIEWAKALVIADKPNEALAAAREIKDDDDWSRALVHCYLNFYSLPYSGIQICF